MSDEPHTNEPDLDIMHVSLHVSYKRANNYPPFRPNPCTLKSNFDLQMPVKFLRLGLSVACYINSQMI